MKSNPVLKAFDDSIVRNPEWGTYIHLCTAIKGSNMSETSIKKLFNSLMPLDEYLKEEKKELTDYLLKLSKRQSDSDLIE